MGSTVFAGLTNVTSEQTEHATPSVAIGRIVCTVCTEYDTIRYGRLTCDQKLTRWPAYSSAQPKNEKIREKIKKIRAMRLNDDDDDGDDTVVGLWPGAVFEGAALSVGDRLRPVAWLFTKQSRRRLLQPLCGRGQLDLRPCARRHFQVCFSHIRPNSICFAFAPPTVSANALFSGCPIGTYVRPSVRPDRSCYHDNSWTAWTVLIDLPGIFTRLPGPDHGPSGPWGLKATEGPSYIAVAFFPDHGKAQFSSVSFRVV